MIVKLRSQSKRWKNLSGQQEYNITPAEGTHGGADPIICKDFIAMIKEGKRPIATPLAGRMSVAAACAGTHSIRNNSVLVEVPAVPDDVSGFVF